MSEDVMHQHISLYVNNYSIELGEQGKKAVMKLLEVYRKQHSETQIVRENIFVN
jgi:1,4-dihydroxy-6-naphthoate synthase